MMLQLTSVFVDESRLVDDALRVVLSVRTTWTKESVNVKIFTDGITNKLVGFWAQDDKLKNDMLLVRVYGQVGYEMRDGLLCSQRLVVVKASNGISRVRDSTD